MRIFLLTIMLFIVTANQSFAGNYDEYDSNENISFKTVEVIVDSTKAALAAYQIDIRYDKNKIKIVGLEGGAEGFNNPPYYDRAGLEGGRIIIASFVDNDSLARKGKTKVARLHLQTTGSVPLEFKTKLMAAAKPGGKEIPVEVEIDIVN